MELQIMTNTTISSKISGIPCRIQVTSFLYATPSRGNAFSVDSSDDYYGYCDFEFVVLDRKGYRANWLAKKMTPADVSRIENEIMTQM